MLMGEVSQCISGTEIVSRNWMRKSRRQAKCWQAFRPIAPQVVNHGSFTAESDLENRALGIEAGASAGCPATKIAVVAW